MNKQAVFIIFLVAIAIGGMGYWFMEQGKTQSTSVLDVLINASSTNSYAIRSSITQDSELLQAAIKLTKDEGITQLAENCLKATVLERKDQLIAIEVREDHNPACGGDRGTAPLVSQLQIDLQTKSAQFIYPENLPSQAMVNSQNTQNPLEPNNSVTNDQINKNKMTTAIVHTNKGDVTINFYDSKVPNTVENFTKLAKSGFYDGVKFHRVIKGFMIQGGDPLSKDDSKQAQWGMGGPGYKFEDELGPENSNAVGTLSMANAGPDTNGSQFFINTKDNNFLDDKHTVFGEVVEGMDVVRAIENTPVGPNDRPIEPVIIKSITFK